MRVGVVGAGMAGLAAARALGEAGHSVTVFERAPWPGGRSASRHVAGVELTAHGTVDLTFDLGAQYFTARDARFAAAVAEWERARVVARWQGRIVAFDGEGWEDVAPGHDRFVGVPSMGALAAHLATGLDVRYLARVTSLAALGAFDRLVVAVPPGEAARLVTAAPALAARAASVAMKPCWAALAAFEERVRARFDAAFVAGSPLGWIARDSSKPRRGALDTWVLHATTEWSAAHLDDPPDAVGPFLLDAFADLVRADVPRPISLTAHRWRHARADPPLSVYAAADPAAGIVMCGDWCAGSRVEGAYLSGLAAASLVVDATRPSSSSSRP